MKVIHIPRAMIWDPFDDITTYELALNTPLLASGTHHLVMYEKLPPEAQRHWRPYSQG